MKCSKYDVESELDHRHNILRGRRRIKKELEDILDDDDDMADMYLARKEEIKRAEAAVSEASLSSWPVPLNLPCLTS